MQTGSNKGGILKKKIGIKMGIFAAGGAIAGYAYYYFIGCKTGTCPITSNPLITTLYGMVMGIVLGFDARLLGKKARTNEEE